MFSIIIIALLLMLLVVFKLMKYSINSVSAGAMFLMSSTPGVSKVGVRTLNRATKNMLLYTRSGALFVVRWSSRCVKVCIGLLIPVAAMEIAATFIAFTMFAGAAGGYLLLLQNTGKEATAKTAVQVAQSAAPASTAQGAVTFRGLGNPGIKDEEWNKASDYAKATINTALAFVQEDKLFYSRAASPGGYDCSAFISANIELATGYTYNGTKVPAGTYDAKAWFDSRLQKSKVNLWQGGEWTQSMLKKVPIGSSAQVGVYPQGDWESKALPGDVLVNNDHTEFYLGHRKSDGKTMFLGSSGPGATGLYKDVNTTVSRTDMGIRTSVYNPPYTIFRPYILMK